MRFLRDLRPAALAAAPWTFALLTLAAGILLLASGATPSEPERFMRLIQVTPVYLIETAHFLSSILGLALVLLAFGLRARLDAAWYATLGVLLLAATLALLKGFLWEETAGLIVLAVLMAPMHAAFPRKARLSRMEVTPGWLVSALAAVIGVGLLGLWSFQHSDYADRPWWRVMVDAQRRARHPRLGGRGAGPVRLRPVAPLRVGGDAAGGRRGRSRLRPRARHPGQGRSR
jgi:phosphatidylglycerol lysyltransferase